MKLTLSNKLFAGFACLSLLTILLGLTTFIFSRHTKENSLKIQQIQEFIIRVKALEATTSLISNNSFTLNLNRGTYIRDLDTIKELSEKILLPGNFPAEQDNLDASMVRPLTYYRQAAINFFDRSELATKIHKRTADIYLQMAQQLQELPVSSNNKKTASLLHQLEVFKHEFEKTNDPDLLNRMNIASRQLQKLNAPKKLIAMATSFIAINEKAHLNTLALLETRHQLTDSSASFLVLADNISRSLREDNEAKFQEIRSITISLILLSISMTLLFWALTSRRLNHFLRNQKRAIYSISSGKYDYETEKISKDELGDVCRFTKELASNLKSEIEERERFQKDKEQLGYQLTQAQKLESIGLLAGGVAHDFNNLLTGINGYTDLALAQLEDSHPVKRYLEIIARSGEKASELTRQLLTFSRKQEMVKQVTAPNELITNLSKLLNRVLGDNIALELTTSPELPEIMADPAQIEQVLMNMAVNAKDAMPNGGKLTIRTSAVTLGKSAISQLDGVDPGDFVQISIADNGTGIPPEIKEKIFDPFFTTKDSDHGSGLGLAMVFGIIRQHNGHVTVDSEPDQGTTFNFFLPALETGTDMSSVTEVTGIELTGGTETILLVDDNDTARDFICETLEFFGYKILAANSGNRAIRTINQTNYTIDLLITDVVMPGMNGRKLAETVRSKHAGIKIIFMSGYTEQSIDQEITSSDLSMDFLRKPISIDTLIHKVREVLDR